MDKNFVIQKIKDLEPWYQGINLNGINTLQKSQSNISVWNKIKFFLPSSLSGFRILDLGSNAGLFSIQSIINGASEVIGIEANKNFYNQSLFVKDFFEDLYKKKLNIKYINDDISNINFEDLGKFDYTFAISILYHIGKFKFGKYTKESLNEQKRIIDIICKISNNVIVRARDNELNNEIYYTKIFNNFNFKNVCKIPEGKRTLILYSKK